MSNEGTHGYHGSGEAGAPDASDTGALYGIPRVLVNVPGGPWRASQEWREVTTEKSRRRTMRAVLRHLDGRVLADEPPSAILALSRQADVLNGWEQARWFHPDHPERWRMQGEVLPRDPGLVRLETAAGLLRGAVLALEASAPGIPLIRQGVDFLRAHGLAGDLPLNAGLPKADPSGQRVDLPGQSRLFDPREG